MLSVPPAADAVVAAAALATASGGDATMPMDAAAAAAAAAASVGPSSSSFADLLQAQMMAAYMPNMHTMQPNFYPQPHMFANPFDTPQKDSREVNNRCRWTQIPTQRARQATPTALHSPTTITILTSTPSAALLLYVCAARPPPTASARDGPPPR